MGRNKIQVNITRLMVLCLTVALLLPVIPAASAVSGQCGNGVNWELTGCVLTISGTGAMENYSELTLAPWQRYAGTIQAVVVQEGVTGVGDCAFFKMERLETVRLSSTVKAIGQWAFYHCTALKIVNMGGATEIGRSAFERCLSLMGVRLPSALQTLRYHAFYRCESLLSISIPASVTNMESSVFAYCINLRSATVLASMSELPLWTFYGCEALQSVSLSSNITSIGTQAFHQCESLNQAVYGGSKEQILNQMPQVDEFIPYLEPQENDKVEISSSGTEQSADGSVVTTDHYIATNNSTINTQIEQKGESVTSQIDAVLDNSDGWKELEEQLSASIKKANTTTADVWLKSDTTVSGEDLGRIAGKDVKLTIHTTQGAQWYIDGKQLAADKLAQEYDLSYTLRELTDPDEKQAETLGGHTGYMLEFQGILDFKVAVELPLSQALYRQSAVFFAPEKDGYQRCQAVMIDQAGIARFYLAQVDAGVEYLIGINVPQKAEQGNQNPVSDVIIPDSMKNEYPKLEQTDEITYIVTGVKSSFGINIGQLTIFLIAGMIICAVAVGVVMRILYKRKLKSGYIPDMRYTDEV